MYFVLKKSHITLRLTISFHSSKCSNCFGKSGNRFLGQNEIDKDYEYKDKEYSERD